MARPKTAFAMWAQYLGARLAEMVLTMRPVARNIGDAALAGQILYRLDRRHRARASHNLRMVFPEWDDDRRDDIARRSFQHLLKLVVEVVYSPRLMHRDSWSRHCRLHLEDLSPAVRLLNSGKPVLMITGHVGNWEIMGTLLALLGYPVEALARPLDNPLINDWLTGIREERGLKLITKWNATDRMLDVIGRGGALGFIADQNAGDRGLFVPFFGKLASTYKSIGLLAISQQVPIICGYAHRVSDAFDYEFGTTDIIHPHDWQGQADPLFYVTARYMRAIELMVRRAPEQYLWVHRRWKSRPRFERLGKPAPASLRQNLEALPWMDAREVDRALEPLPPYVNR
jgi:KDO2-lipid IV(A) lauroyltransferase